MAQVRPSSMYSATGEEERVEEEGSGGGLLESILVLVSILLVLLTLPLSVWQCVKVAQEYERVVIFRLGRVQQKGVRGPGIFLILPCMDQVVVVDLRTGVHNIPSQDLLTSDLVPISVDAVLYFRVEDPLLAVVGNDNYVEITLQKAQAAIRTCLGTRTLQELLTDREEVGIELKAGLQDNVKEYGIAVDRVEIMQIGLPQDMQRTLASEAEAGVQARAKVILSKGEEEASRKLVEAAKGSNLVSIHLSYLQTMTKVNQEMAYVCPFPFDIINAYLENLELEDGSKKEETKQKGDTIRRRKRTKKTSV